MFSPDTVFQPEKFFLRYEGVSVPASGRKVGGARAPAGVDLSLDAFDLVDAAHATGTAALEPGPEVVTAIGKIFWTSLDGGDGALPMAEAGRMLREVFNQQLSDRRHEGDRFVPPETSPSYVQQLQQLLKEEEVCKERRRRHFCSREFTVEDPGPLFSSSWKASFEIAHAREARGTSPQGALLYERQDYKAEALVFETILRTTTPVFHRTAEDGMQFRIYKFGSLEVRTTQEQNTREVIGVVFSTHAPRPRQATSVGDVERVSIDQERIVKATQYVEEMSWNRGEAGCHEPNLKYHAYVVLETEQATSIATEMQADGAVMWEINPQALEVRNSLAKVFSAGECRLGGLCVRDLKCYQAQEAERSRMGTICGAAARSRSYAEGVCRWAGQACGGSSHVVG
jgi:hypothetical protein